MDIIYEKQDLTYLSWAKIRHSSGTAGSFLKAYSELSGEKIYYKLSNYDSYKGIIGYECVNEIIVARLLQILGIEHLDYQLIHADILLDGKLQTTYLCASRDFKQKGESKIALDACYQAGHMDDETPLEFCVRNGWGNYIYEMLLVDFLILNRDRHGANIEVLKNPKKKQIRLAPLFDHGLSLLFQCKSREDVEAADVMEDKRVQSFVGSNSVRENLNLIPADRLPKVHGLKASDREALLCGLDQILPDYLLDKIWKMIFERWNYYEDFCRSR